MFRSLFNAICHIRSSRRSITPHATAGMFESLERRRLMSVSSYNGMVFVDGTDQADQIAVFDTWRTVTSVNGLTTLERNIRISETTGGTTTSRTFRASDVNFIRINGWGGDDTITVNSLNGVSMYGGAGSDYLSGGSGRDYIFGDLTDLGEVGVVQLGTAGHDTILGTGGNDHLDGNAGNDVIYGGAGNDTLIGGAGSDALYGEAGDDTLRARDGTGFDTVDGGDGNDTAEIDDFRTLVNVGGFYVWLRVRDSVSNVESVTT